MQIRVTKDHDLRLTESKILAFKAGPDVLSVPKAQADALIQSGAAVAVPKSRSKATDKE